MREGLLPASGLLFLFFAWLAPVLCHLLVFVGVEDLAALLALHVLHFVLACYDANPGMLADWLHDLWDWDGMPAIATLHTGAGIR